MIDPAHVQFREITPGMAEYTAALALRHEVLRRPLGLSITAEEMQRDLGCIHLVGMLGDELACTLLLQPIDARTVQMRQVAVRPEFQGHGLGARLLIAGEEAARRRGFCRLIAHARASAVAFYERHGYALEGDVFLETTIPHQLVVKQL